MRNWHCGVCKILKEMASYRPHRLFSTDASGFVTLQIKSSKFLVKNKQTSGCYIILSLKEGETRNYLYQVYCNWTFSRSKKDNQSISQNRHNKDSYFIELARFNHVYPHTAVTGYSLWTFLPWGRWSSTLHHNRSNLVNSSARQHNKCGTEPIDWLGNHLLKDYDFLPAKTTGVA